MNSSIAREIDSWEDEGGAVTPALASGEPALAGLEMELSGTPAQVEWAECIRRQVNTEFDRVVTTFRAVASRQSEPKRTDTQSIIGIVEDKRAAVMSRKQAGYFIHDWQEISDQVRQMISQDERYQAIKAKRAQHISSQTELKLETKAL